MSGRWSARWWCAKCQIGEYRDGFAGRAEAEEWAFRKERQHQPVLGVCVTRVDVDGQRAPLDPDPRARLTRRERMARAR